MEEVYRLFDRRCRMATALAKLERLRARVPRFGRLRKVLKKLLAPGLEKAWCFWTSGCWDNVERGGAWQPSLPQDAEDGVPGSDAAGDRGPTGAGPTAGAAHPRPGHDDQGLAQGEGGMMR